VTKSLSFAYNNLVNREFSVYETGPLATDVTLRHAMCCESASFTAFDFY
jgi:hypothetical protein